MLKYKEQMRDKKTIIVYVYCSYAKPGTGLQLLGKAASEQLPFSAQEGTDYGWEAAGVVCSALQQCHSLQTVWIDSL